VFITILQVASQPRGWFLQQGLMLCRRGDDTGGAGAIWCGQGLVYTSLAAGVQGRRRSRPGGACVARRKGLVINDRQLDRCDDLLLKLKEVSGSSFLALISTSGQPITTASDSYHPETLSLASLAASSFAATQQLASILDENEFTLLFHEGKALNLHVAQVTDQVLLVVTFGRETQVGKVRLYTQRAIEVLRQIFDGPEDENTPAMDVDFESAAGDAMDDLFRDV
jgi:predicted regulator of Ras-like GTPase activity (Roadblock/LC7/MglB family)